MNKPSVLVEGMAVKLSSALLIFHSGAHRRRFGDDVDRVRATLLMHLAVEMAVHAVAATIGNINLDKSIKKVMNAVEPSVPSLGGYDKYRKFRNTAQHEGSPPTATELESMARVAEKVLRECFQVCSADFDRLTLTRWVRNEVTRRLLQQAEAEAHADQFGVALVHASRAHQWIREASKQLAALTHDIDTWETYSPMTGMTLQAATADGRAKMTAMLLDGLVSAGLGFDLADEIRLRALCKVESPSSQQTWWSIAYVARHAWRLEDALPQLRSAARDFVRPTTAKAAYLDQIMILNSEPKSENTE